MSQICVSLNVWTIFYTVLWTSAVMAVRIICGKFKIWSVLEELCSGVGDKIVKLLIWSSFQPHHKNPIILQKVANRTFHNVICFYGEELLAPRPTSRLEDHPLSAVCDCLFSIFAAPLHIWKPFLHPQPEDVA
jgi:hypothetical protein